MSSELPLIGEFSTPSDPSSPLADAKIGIITFPGTLDEGDAARAVHLAGGTPVPLWHNHEDPASALAQVDAVIIPGGFSYGDYLRAGAIARFAPMMEALIIRAGADSGAGSARALPVLGICNGFQILTEAGLLPGSMIKNDHLKFRAQDQPLIVENTATPWTSAYQTGEQVVFALKNQDGQYVADEKTLDELEGSGRVVFRYAGENPNGSRRGIAGIANAGGNIVGLMPHPEHAVEAGFGPDSPAGMKMGTDGLGMFTSVLSAVVNSDSASTTGGAL